MEVTAPLEQVGSVAKEIVEIVGTNAIVLLNGTLAAGKTTLVSYIVSTLGLGSATSPTFSLQQCYDNRVFHYDFYRLSFEEIASLGLIEELERDGLHLVEWADDTLKELLIDAGFKLFELDIQIVSSNSRKYRLKALNA